MYKKLLISFIVLTFCIFSFSVCFANSEHMLQDAANGVRDAVGGAENTIENGVKDISNTAKDATGKTENATKNATGMTQNNNSNYNATRTSTTSNNTFMGMSATAWTWLILGVAGIAIVALVWYYGTQVRTSNNDDE